MSTSRDADKFVVRMPEGMREQIAEVARENHRSMNSEIVMRIQQSLEHSADFPTSKVNAPSLRAAAPAKSKQATPPNSWTPTEGQLVEHRGAGFGIIRKLVITTDKNKCSRVCAEVEFVQGRLVMEVYPNPLIEPLLMSV